MPLRILTVTGTPAVVSRARRRATIDSKQPALVGQRAAAPLAGDLGHRAAEVQVDVVGEVLAARPCARPRARRRGRRRRAAATRISRPAPNLTIAASPGPARPGPRGDHLETKRPPPYSRHSRRNATFVIPAIGASTTGGSRRVSFRRPHRRPAASEGCHACVREPPCCRSSLAASATLRWARRVERVTSTDLVEADALLGHGVALAHGDRAVLQGVEVDRHAERGADLVLPAVAPPDRARRRRSRRSSACAGTPRGRGPSARGRRCGTAAAPRP